MTRKDKHSLLVGVAEVDITPPVGTALMGSLRPRKAIGIEDPLYAKAIVLASGGTTIAYVLLDLCVLQRRVGDAAVRLASRKAGIPADRIVWAANHTHTGPFTIEMSRCGGCIDRQWLATVPRRFAEAVAAARARLQPARVSRCRGFHVGLVHNRRLLFKDGKSINTWNLGQAREAQCVGSEGPVDPEIGMLAFERLDGELLAVMFQYTLHTNTNFGPRFSADYPAVVGARLRERFGPQVVGVFVPGACGNINSPGPRYREVGNALADVMIPLLEQRRPVEGPVPVDAMKREVVVPFRDFTRDQAKRIRESGWNADGQDFFHRELKAMRKEGATKAKTVVQAWRIGDTGFASLPGELFVEWGLRIKRESPFPWTFPVELGGDYLGYLISHEAWNAGAYEALVSRLARPTPGGVGTMVDQALDMLKELKAKGGAK